MNTKHAVRREVTRRLGSNRPHTIIARILSTSASPSTFSTGGTYIPNRREIPSSSHTSLPRILGRPSPRLHGALRRRLLFIGTAQQHPIPVRLEHGVQVVDAPQVVAQLRRAHLDHKAAGSDASSLYATNSGCSRGRLKFPRIFFGSIVRRHFRSFWV